MRGTALSKLFFTGVQKNAKAFRQPSLLPNGNPYHISCHEPPQREVLSSSLFTEDAHSIEFHQDGRTASSFNILRHAGTDSSSFNMRRHASTDSPTIVPRHCPSSAHRIVLQQSHHCRKNSQHDQHCCCHGHSHHQHHCAHFSTNSSADSDMDPKNTFDSPPAKERKLKNALTLKIQTLCKSNLSDQEAAHTLEALVHEIKSSDDPEGLVVGAVYLKLATMYGSTLVPGITKGLSYAKKAVEVYEPRGPSLKLATCFYISAVIHITMGDCNSALSQLEQSERVMRKIRVTPCDKYCVALKHDVQSVMGEACDQFCNEVNFEVQALFGVAKSRLGMHDEAAYHIRKSVKFKQKLLQVGSPALGMFYLDRAEALKSVNDHKAAAQLCQKALKIFRKCCGSNSLEEAKARSLLSNIYYDLGKYEESLSESRSARVIWKHVGRAEELICSNLNAERSLVRLQRWNEAMSRLDEVIQATDLGNTSYTIALILAAKVCLLSNEDDSATHYYRRALEALEHQGPCPQTAGTLMLLSIVYEDRKEFQQAALLCKKAKEIYDHCLGSEALTIAAEIEGKIGCLLVHAGKHEEAILYLESCISKLKHVPGKDLLYAHFYLGLAYPQVEKYQDSFEQFEAAKCLSSSVEVGISMQVAIHSNLAASYSALDRLDEAIECQKEVVDLVRENEVEDYTLEEVKMRLTSYIREAKALKESAWHNR